MSNFLALAAAFWLVSSVAIAEGDDAVPNAGVGVSELRLPEEKALRSG